MLAAGFAMFQIASPRPGNVLGLSMQRMHIDEFEKWNSSMNRLLQFVCL